MKGNLLAKRAYKKPVNSIVTSGSYGSSGDCTYLRPVLDHCQHKGNRRTLDVELIQMMCVKDPAISPKEPNWFSRKQQSLTSLLKIAFVFNRSTVFPVGCL
uniref:Uncharacterized protein n=1 Tax=Glossina palpalis gambiensis TaxID=67801 RepID=A0A1B0C1K5_9MUSC